MTRFDTLFQLLHDRGGSDLHLSAGTQPRLRVHGVLQCAAMPEITSSEILALLRDMLLAAPASSVSEESVTGDLLSGEERLRQFELTGELDCVCERSVLSSGKPSVPDDNDEDVCAGQPFIPESQMILRYRVNGFRQRRGIGAVFRAIPRRVPTLSELGFAPSVRDLLCDLALLPKGLILVTGPTGCGKSTTLAAMIDHANTVRQDHILTIEDPVEFLHTPRKCLLNQREIGRDSRSFSAALRGALREDPDIILVGEMRDRETISLALEAAETGHLVFATLHTASAPKAIDRIVEVFPPIEQAQIRTSLSESLQAVLAQTLFRRTDRQGRIPALEIMLGVPAVRNLIRENKTFQLYSILQTSRATGMQTLDDAIEQLLRLRLIDPEEARLHLRDSGRLTGM